MLQARLLTLTVDAYVGYLADGQPTGTTPSRTRTVGAATRARRLATLTSFYRYALDVGGWAARQLGERNPAQRARRPQLLSGPRSAYLSQAQVRSLMELLARRASEEVRRRPRDHDPAWLWRQQHAMVCCLYLSAMRISSVLSLRRGDRTTINGVSYAWVVLNGHEEQREALELTATADAALARLERHRPPAGRLFLSPTGRELSSARAAQLLKAAARDAGLPAISPHSLRHSALTHARERGADLRTIQLSARHAHAAATEGYLHDELPHHEFIGHLLDRGSPQT
ncbi:MAG: tyrosine-type recombinase/integrase [Solirubrobacteraceae bacterium]